MCPSEFRKLNSLLDRVKKADMALYLHFTEVDLDVGMKIVSGEDYLDANYFHVLSNTDSLGLAIAPRKALIDLRTMKIVALDLPLSRSYSIEEMIEACEKL